MKLYRRHELVLITIRIKLSITKILKVVRIQRQRVAKNYIQPQGILNTI